MLPCCRRRSRHESHRPCFPFPPLPFTFPKRAHLDQLSLRAQTSYALSPIRRWNGDVWKLPASRCWATRTRMLAHIRTEISSSSSSSPADSARGAVVRRLCGPLVIRSPGHECTTAHALWAIVRALPARGLCHGWGSGVVGENGTTATATAPDYAGPQDDEYE